MMSLTLRHGVSRELTRDFPAGTRVRDLTNDATVRAALGLSESVQAVVDGRTLGANDQLNDGDIVTFEKQAASKA